jgi:hypothetical protein
MCLPFSIAQLFPPHPSNPDVLPISFKHTSFSYIFLLFILNGDGTLITEDDITHCASILLFLFFTYPALYSVIFSRFRKSEKSKLEFWSLNDSEEGGTSLEEHTLHSSHLLSLPSDVEPEYSYKKALSIPLPSINQTALQMPIALYSLHFLIFFVMFILLIFLLFEFLFTGFKIVFPISLLVGIISAIILIKDVRGLWLQKKNK